MKKASTRTRPPEGPRRAAWRILLSWESGDEALEALRDAFFRKSPLHERDRALVMELTQGTVRHLGFLDHTIRSCLDHPDTGLPGPVQTALRLGAYQLVHLHRIPAHAAVKETVELLKESRYRRFVPLANAVLRRISDKGPAPAPSRELEPARHLEVATSSPPWLVKRLLDDHTYDETLQILQALNRTPPMSLRINSSRTDRQELIGILGDLGVSAREGRHSPYAVVLESRAQPWELPPFKEGLCTVQDEGAQLVALLLSPRPGQKILDACAAPGGKTAHLSELISGKGFILAVDRVHKRMLMVKDNLSRLGAGGVHLLTGDLGTAGIPLSPGHFDSVLLDAPCSGTGVLRRHPEGKWKKDPGTIGRMTEVQSDLLAAAIPMLKTGGALLYTTCSILREENELVVDRFLAGNRRMEAVDLRERFPNLDQSLFSQRGDLRLWPHIHGCDGFYACLMEKKK